MAQKQNIVRPCLSVSSIVFLPQNQRKVEGNRPPFYAEVVRGVLTRPTVWAQVVESRGPILERERAGGAPRGG